MTERSESVSPPGLDARRIAMRVLVRVLDRHQALDEALDEEESNGLAALDRRDRAFVRALTGVTLRRFGQIEAVLAPRLRRGPPSKAPLVRPILLMGAAQLLFLSAPAHAAVDMAVRLAAEDEQAKHFTGLVNAVLRGLARDGQKPVEAQDAARLNVPNWLWRRWTKAYGEADARRIAEWLSIEPSLDLTARDPAALAAELGGILLPTGSVRVEAHGPVSGLPGYEDGRWWVQDAAAALPAKLFGDVRGLTIADLCAAPGGKTAQLAANGAEVTAVDRSAARMKRLEKNMARLKLTVETVVADALDWRPDRLFDAVLLDAPCMATGTIRRRPDILLNKSAADLGPLTSLQARLLRRAVDLVKPGGTIVYGVCSLEPEEGEDQIHRLLAENPLLSRVPIRSEEVGFDEAITPKGDLRTLPFHLSGLDGFFAARIKKTTEK